MDADGQIGKLCNWIYDIKLGDIPSDVQERAIYLILDGIACLLVGAHLPWSELLLCNVQVRPLCIFAFLSIPEFYLHVIVLIIVYTCRVVAPLLRTMIFHFIGKIHLRRGGIFHFGTLQTHTRFA